MTSNYYRSPILHFSELTDEQRANVDIEDEDCRYVLESEDSVYPISLSNFMRIDRKGSMWDGYYTTSNTSAYMIKISKCGSVATVAAKYW